MALLSPIIITVLLGVAAYVLQKLNAQNARKRQLAKFPLLEAYGMDFLPVTHKGYVEYLKKGKPYRLRTSPAGEDDRIMLPFKYIDEVKNSSETSGLSFLLFSEQSMLLQYSKGPCQTPACTFAVKQFLNRSLADRIPQIHSGVATDIANLLPKTKDWSPTAFYPIMISIIARNAARVLADPALCDNEEWIQMTIGITIQTFMAATSIRQKLNPAWYFLAPFLDQSTKDIVKCRKRAAEIIEPIYEAHKLKAKSQDEKVSQTTGMTWLLSSPSGQRNPSTQQVADDLLFLSIAGIHTTTASLMIAIHDLISHPDALKSVREEIDQAYPKDGFWKASELANLDKLDSFMKESQRIHPMGMLTMSRAPYNNFKFQDGLEIPAHTLVGMASQELNMDADIFPNPEAFDADRFLKLKESSGSNKYTFTAVAEDISINFGAGQHACPGRALAGNTMKIVLAELLRKYEIKFENEEQPPPMMATALGRSVDPAASLLIRQAATSA